MTLKIKNMFNKIKSIHYGVIFNQLLEDYIKFPLYILTHPIKGYEDFKFENKGKMHVAIVYLLLMVVASSFKATGAGFLVSAPFTGDFSIVRTFFLITVPVVLLAIGNWSITSLFDGKGNMSDIFKVICYAIIPIVWLGIPMTVLSNYLIQEELAIYQAVNGIAIFFTGYMALFGLLVIHEYGLLKTLLTVVFSAIAVAVIIFIGLLILTLFQQLYGFIMQIYDEFIIRNS